MWGRQTGVTDLCAAYEVLRVVRHEVPHALVGLDLGLLEELLRGAAVQAAVLDLRLAAEPFGVLDGRLEPLGGEEGSQVGGVGRDHYEGEEPPSYCERKGELGLAE